MEDIIEINEYQTPGTYVLSELEIKDKVGNIQKYKKNPTPYEIQYFFYKPLVPTASITINNIHALDNEPPLLTSITLNKTTVTAPGFIKITVTGIDNDSGIVFGSVAFEDSSTSKILGTSVSTSYQDPETFQTISTNPGTLEGLLQISRYEPSGTYELLDLHIVDKANNSQLYLKNPSQQDLNNGIKPLDYNLSFEILNNNDYSNITPFEIKSITLNKSTIGAPGSFAVELDCGDDIEFLGMIFEERSSKKLFGNNVYYGLFNKDIYLNVSSYQSSGIYDLIEVTAIDSSWRYSQKYHKNPTKGMLKNGYKALPNSVFIKIVNDISTKLVTDTHNLTLANDINGVLPQEGEPTARVVIDYKGNPTLPQNVFDAIAGKDVEIILDDGDVQWVFNGNDIIETTKEIDLKVNIQSLETKGSIKDLVNGKPSVVLSFAENGVLPGKAKIRVRSELLKDLISSNGVSVYFYNATENKLELIVGKVTVTSDGYFEFNITHNSDYVVTKNPGSAFLYNAATNDSSFNYWDNPIPINIDEKESKANKNIATSIDNPKTGDENNTVLYSVLIVLSLGVLLVMGKRVVRNRE